MKKHVSRWILIPGITLLLAVMGIATFFLTRPKPVVLELGTFAGSNWDVANAYSFTIIDTAIARFEKEHPGVTVHYSSGIPKEDYSEWLSRKILSGNTPDVFMVLSDDFDPLSSLGVLKDLGENIHSDKDFDSAAFYQSALATGQKGGKQYALPYEVVPTLMFVNKSLLIQEGIEMPSEDWTWTDLYQICKQLAQDGDENGSLDRFGTLNFNWRDVVATNGVRLFDDDGKQANFTDERVMEAIRFNKQIYDLNQGQKVSQEDFDNGNVAFMPLSFAEYRTYKTYPYKIKKYTNFQWDCITMPAGKQGGNISEIDTLLMGINNKSKHADLAWEFLKLLTYDETLQMDIFRYSQGASVLKAVTGSKQMEQILQEDMEVGEKVIDHSLLSRVIENGSIVPKFSRYNDAMALAENEISKILESDESIDRTLKFVQRTINRYLTQ